MAALKFFFFILDTMIPSTTHFQHLQVGPAVLQRTLELSPQGVWLVLAREAELVLPALEKPDLAGVVQRSPLADRLIP